LASFLFKNMANAGAPFNLAEADATASFKFGSLGRLLVTGSAVVFAASDSITATDSTFAIGRLFAIAEDAAEPTEVLDTEL
jgi:hypothetical protein